MATLRLIFLITTITTGSAWLIQRSELLYNGPALAGGTSPFGQVFIAIPVLVLALTSVLRRWLPQGERATLYAALVIGVSATGAAFLHRFLPGLVTGYYGGFASPTGLYYRFLKIVPPWLVPGSFNEPPAVGAFEGGVGVPWSAWMAPMAVWGLFFVLLFGTSLCLVAIFRRRWMEVERLGFPLLELPLGLLRNDLLGRPLFWWGCLIPGLLFGINGLHHYHPAVGELSTTLDLGHFLLEEPWKAMATFESSFIFQFSPLLIGVAFLAPVEISFSTWFFFLFSRVQLLVTQMMGRMEERGEFITGHGSPWLDWPGHFPFLMCQARGGLLFLAGFSLWAARGSMREMFSLSRGAVWGFLAGCTGLWLWIVAIGVPPLMGALTLLLFFLISLAFVRMRVDGGLPITTVHQIVGYLFFVTLGTGPGLFADETYVAFGFLAVLGFTIIGMWPAMQFEGLKLAEQSGVSDSRMIWAMVLGLLVGLVSGTFFTLDTVYEYGLFAMQEQGGARNEARIGRFYLYLIKDAGTVEGGTDWLRLGFHAVGGGITWILAALRQHFLRWPFHPMGFVFGIGFGWRLWGPALLGWFAKWLTVRYGGATTYRKVRPLFLGLIFGEICMRALWAAVALWQAELGMGFGM
ncbi:MAG: hypothetical protein HOH74_20130 [Gemmatimonadetes bacterium]|nr:hypothetical protein [Gemmatimonadota bacterium]